MSSQCNIGWPFVNQTMTGKYSAPPPDPSTPHRRTAGAFTLIELPVVIAIIAVLAAMLMPALAKARQAAKAARCASNHKQIAMAFLMYADENSDQLPSIDRINCIDAFPYMWYNLVPSYAGCKDANQ